MEVDVEVEVARVMTGFGQRVRHSGVLTSADLVHLEVKPYQSSSSRKMILYFRLYMVVMRCVTAIVIL